MYEVVGPDKSRRDRVVNYRWAAVSQEPKYLGLGITTQTIFRSQVTMKVMILTRFLGHLTRATMQVHVFAIPNAQKTSMGFYKLDGSIRLAKHPVTVSA